MAVAVHAHFKRIAFEARRRQAIQAAEKSSATQVAEQAARMEAQRAAESAASQPSSSGATESTRPQGMHLPLSVRHPLLAPMPSRVNAVYDLLQSAT